MIYLASEKDYPKLLNVWESAVKSTHDFLAKEDFEFYKAQMPIYFNNLTLHAYQDDRGEIKGFLGMMEDKIEMLFVDSNSMGMGIGKQLMNFAINKLNARKLDVNEQNVQALGFYNHLGFKTVGRSELDGEGKKYPILHLKRIDNHKNKKSLKLS